MIPPQTSLKRRLALWLIAIVAGLGTLLLIEAYTSACKAADRAMDGQLEAASLTIAESLQWPEGNPTVEMPASALQILATRWQERVFYWLQADNGVLITQNADLLITDAMQAEARRQPVYLDAVYDDQPIRLSGREVDSAGWDTQEPVQLWVGHTRRGRDLLAQELFRKSATRFAAMVLITAALVAIAMRTMLAPLRRLRQTLRDRSADDISPLRLGVPKEMLELVETLNRLFADQRHHRDALLRFIADASHQLKTPLAGLQSTSELALTSREPAIWHQALEAVHDSAERTSRLAGQMLSLTRLQHLGPGHERHPLALDRLIREVATDWADRQDSRDHDLGLVIDMSTPVWVEGESWALHELLNNLIDNACRYTPPGSEITLTLEGDDERVTLSIKDDGPGVDAESLGRLTQPFERGRRQDTCGSGLGLAIAESIALRHGGQLAVSNRQPRGLRVTLTLARCRPPEEHRA
ncbi:sensor histidine kinase N-terminal domain-containing protein [Salinicola sp. LHM]|uniref:sensor histidine kinase n=1 Tax=Salinicola sp. LHM TaxID=3065298 RepID=UPI002ACEE58D|nr:sensor histidine kinase N-terminal domain-containing protein [Salinicola sp. LHM]WQH32572.1 sensor histidine kinase N-terminal domain-containing protein [Salinicola sp. LHM]